MTKRYLRVGRLQPQLTRARINGRDSRHMPAIALMLAWTVFNERDIGNLIKPLIGTQLPPILDTK